MLWCVYPSVNEMGGGKGVWGVRREKGGGRREGGKVRWGEGVGCGTLWDEI